MWITVRFHVQMVLGAQPAATESAKKQVALETLSKEKNIESSMPSFKLLSQSSPDEIPEKTEEQPKAIEPNASLPVKKFG